MKNSVLTLKAFGEYEHHSRTTDGRAVSEFKKRVVLGQFLIHGVRIYVPLPVFDYPGNVLAIPLVTQDGDQLSTRFDQWRLFDMVTNRDLPITLCLLHPGMPEVVTLICRYVEHARELDDDALAEWAPKAAAQLGVRV